MIVYVALKNCFHLFFTAGGMHNSYAITSELSEISSITVVNCRINCQLPTSLITDSNIQHFIGFSPYIIRLLSLAGDVESNPGPVTRQALLSAKGDLGIVDPSESEGDENNILAILKNIQADVKDLKENMQSINSSIEQLKVSQATLTKQSEATSRHIAELQTDNKNLRQTISEMQSQQDYMNGQLRRNNLIIHGIDQSDKETWDETELKVREFLSKEVSIENDNMEIERAHRLSRARTIPQPIVVKFTKYKDRAKVYSAGKKFKRGDKFGITEDLSPGVREKRRKLQPFLAEAKRAGKLASLRHDKLVIDGETFVLDKSKEEPSLKKVGGVK